MVGGHWSIGLLLIAGSVFAASCGGGAGAGGDGSGTGGAPDGGADAGAGYSARYVADPAGLHVGKSRFRLEVTTQADGKPAAGLASTLQLSPLMQMSKMSHGAPVPVDAVTESATPGVYDCTLFFPMASVDAGGNPQGNWSLAVGVGGKSAGVLDLVVMPPPDQDTTHVALKNAADTITSMGTAKLRSWFLFRDTLVAASGGHALTLFLATVQEGMMVWPPVTVGLTLVDSTGAEQMTVESLALEASTDGTTWSPMSCDAQARCVSTLSGLPQGVAANVYVKLAVDGVDYTTDGSPPDLAKQNGFATFSVTAP